MPKGDKETEFSIAPVPGKEDRYVVLKITRETVSEQLLPTKAAHIKNQLTRWAAGKD